jgi:hypothetical protein
LIKRGQTGSTNNVVGNLTFLQVCFFLMGVVDLRFFVFLFGMDTDGTSGVSNGI